MNYELVRKALLGLDEDDQKRLITEVVPELWRVACRDESCAASIKGLLDADVVRPELEAHMWGI